MNDAWSFLKDGWAVLTGMILFIGSASVFFMKYFAKKTVDDSIRTPDTGQLIFPTHNDCDKKREDCQKEVCKKIDTSQEIVLRELKFLKRQNQTAIDFMGTMDQARDEAKEKLDEKMDKALDTVGEVASQVSKLEGKFEQFQKDVKKMNGG